MENLLKIQRELKAPKGQYNSFGKYKYRSCEDILEAVKPLCEKYGCLLTLSDDIVQVGDRFYVKATARVRCGDDYIDSTAYARESFDKKGQDESQITGTASSYARKYALNGLFLIDDTKDADTDENRNERQSRQSRRTAPKEAPKEQPKEMTSREKVIQLARERNIPFEELMQDYGITKATTEERFAEILKDMEG